MALATAILGSLANVIISKCEEVSSSIMVLYSGLGTDMVLLWISVADPWHFGVDPDPRIHAFDPDADPDPSIFIIDLQDANKKLI